MCSKRHLHLIAFGNKLARLLLVGGAFLSLALAINQRCLGQWELNKQQAQQVETYLKKVGAEKLLIEQLELETASETNQVLRRDKARRLLNVYAEKMMSGRIDQANWQTKAELLLKLYPDLATPTIRLAILQSKYVLGEKSYEKWWANGRNQESKTGIIDQWQALRTELVELNRFIESEYQDKIATSQNIDNRENVSDALLQVEGALLHTNYLLGWSYYFAGVLDSDQQKSLMRLADQQFRNFLQIESTQSLTTIKASWFDFSSQWQTRALVGLAMTQRGLNYPKQCSHCFDLIETNSNQQYTRDMRYVWELNSRLFLNEYNEALKLVDLVATKNNISKKGRVGFWKATLDGGLAIKSVAPEISAEILITGLAGLTRESQGAFIETFLTKNELELSTEPDKSSPSFELLWIAGSQKYRLAQSQQSERILEEAKQILERALNSAPEHINPLDGARCRFLIAKIECDQGNLATAADSLIELSLAFDPIERETAAEAQWLAAQSLAELCREQPRYLIQTRRVIDSLSRRFPGSTYAQRGEFEKLKLGLSGLTNDEALNRLSAINSSSPNYPLALNEIAKRRYQSWALSDQNNSVDEPKKLQALIDSEVDYRRRPMASDASKLKLVLLVVDALLKNEDFDEPQIQQKMNVAEEFARGVQTNHPLLPEFRYYKFLIANRANDSAKANTEINWLLKNAKGTRFERSALVQHAQTEDQRMQSSPNPTPQQIEQLIATFERLVDFLGDTTESITTNNNARIAYARLAKLKSTTGRTELALKMYLKLSKAFPNNRSYLRQCGLLLSEANQFDEAISIWKRLANGIEPGTDLWLEAKCNLTLALLKTDKKPDALALYHQTLRLTPPLNEFWKKQFDELLLQLKSD